jgi:hypothetical protein
MAGVVEARIRLLTATHQERWVARNAAYKAHRSQKRQVKHNTTSGYVDMMVGNTCNPTVVTSFHMRGPVSCIASRDH